jgi:Tfp pilus assembly protein FimV
MIKKENPQKLMSSYKKQQQLLPYVAALAVLLVTIGLIILVVWLSGPNRIGGLFATATATPTETSLPTDIPPTETITLTATETMPPTETLTLTPSGPFQYQVQEGDTCWDIAAKFGVVGN